MNRTKNSPAYALPFFMFRHRARNMEAAPAAPPMRYARPGERPPSMRPAGTNDTVIERFDAFAKQLRKIGHHG